MVMQFRMLLDCLDAAVCDSALSQALTSFANCNGFDYHAYLGLEGFSRDYFGTFPTDWQNYYLKNDLACLDPVVRQAKRSSGTFIWSTTGWLHSRDTKLRKFASDAIAHGITHGLAISARTSFDRQLILSFASSHGDYWRPGTLELSDGVPLLMELHHRLKELRQTVPQVPARPLSSRERLCLIWAAKGKTAIETGTLTQLSHRTVQSYLDTARSKLGAATVAQLVANAKDMKLI